MAGYDARKVGEWARKVTGRNLIPAKYVSKTRQQQRDEAAEKELDKFDMSKQKDDDNPSGLVSSGLGPAMASNSLNSLVAANQSYQNVMTRVLQQQMLGSMGWGLTKEDQEAARKVEEEAKRIKAEKLASLKSKIETLNNSEATMAKRPIPDYIHTLTGWRGWRVGNGRLQALGMSGEWEPKVAKKAICTVTTYRALGSLYTTDDSLVNKHFCPSMSCTCGYWTFKSLGLLTKALEGYMDYVVVLGTVECWGKVIDCENGYRSEFAYPKELWLLQDGLEYLGWTYGVPIRKLSN